MPGNKRPGPGRPAGGKNSAPPKSAAAASAFAEMVRPKLKELFNVLYGIATNSEARPSDRIRATSELLDRSMGRSVQSIIVADDRSEPAETNSEELLGIFDEAPTVPEIEE